MVKDIKLHNGQPINVDESFVTLTANVICDHIFGETIPEGHKFDNFSNPAKSIATIKMKHVTRFFDIKDAASLEIERNSIMVRNLIRNVKRGDQKRHDCSARISSYEDTTLAGVRIPKGCTIEIPKVRIHRDPDVLKKPCAFIPERWLQDDLEFQNDLEKVGDDKSKQANAFMTFSQGTHSCLGMNLANLELIVATALLVKNFDIKYNNLIPTMTGTMVRLEPAPLIELHPRNAE
ncbi:cytochrome P450 [Umbelopsis sp. PMI_123]|nr:cytochrome P450 [Umbelopsis sp. PMI_123]